MQFNQSKSSTISSWKKLSPSTEILAMGNFDGVHTGHKNLLNKAKKLGNVTILTYSPHPAIALGRIKNPFLLTTDFEKKILLIGLSVKNIIFLNFDEDVSKMKPENFAKKIIKEKLNPKKVIVGYDHHFGKDRKGDTAYLKTLGKRFGFEVIVFEEVRIEGEVVKSSVIRELIHEGEFKLVKKLLGHPYSISGTVIKGDGLGGELGYPTANLKLDSDYKLLPPNGVYSSIVKMKDKDYPAMLYIGSSPTHKIYEKKIELHLIDFDKNLYEKRIVCDVYSFIRKEQHFSSRELLKESINKNKKEVMKNLKEVYR
jgi:riboflavin kinase/FMN adenylyltransferase